MKLILELNFSLHHLQVELQWSPCFTYAHNPLPVRIQASCPSFWSLLCIGQYIIWIMLFENIINMLFTSSSLNISFIKYYLSYCTLKPCFASIWGDFDEFQCNKDYMKLWEWLSGLYMFNVVSYISIIFHISTKINLQWFIYLISYPS